MNPAGLKPKLNFQDLTRRPCLLGTEPWVYYGGADTVIGVAKGDVSEFLQS